MTNNTCPNCGKEVPEGSKFCNHCGSVMTPAEIECPSCHNRIPGDSSFCPVCRAKIEKPVTGPNAWATNGAQGGAAKPEDHRVRNIIIGVLALLFVSIFVVNKCFYSGNNTPLEPSLADTTDGNDQNLIDIFNRTLETNNLKLDGDRIAYVLAVPNDSGSMNKLVGVTYLSDETHSFYKIYILNKNGSEWEIKQADATKYINGRTVIFDQGELRASEMPAIKNIGGKNYFYFAYADMPKDSEMSNPNAFGKIASLLFDIDGEKIAREVDFQGNIVRNSEGLPQVMVTTYTAGSGILDKALIEYAQGIGYLHIPSPEEIAAEKAAKEAEEAKKAAADSAALAEEQKRADDFNNGAEVKVENVQEFDKNNPQFRADDFSKKINGAGYTVFLLKSGKVYAYNSASGKTFQVKFGGTATDVGWADSNTGVLNIRTASGRVQYNLKSHTIKKAE